MHTCEYLEPVEMINVDIVGGDINRELLEERVSTSLDHHLVTELRLHQLLGQSHGGEGEQHVHVGEVLAQRVQEPDVLTNLVQELVENSIGHSVDLVQTALGEDVFD